MINRGYIALVNSDYPGTKISGRKIDHIIISLDFDPEWIEDVAKVLVPSMDFEEYRKEFIDHFSILINVKLHKDDD